MSSILKSSIRIIKAELLNILIILLFIFLSSKALFHSGFFRTVDDITTVRIVYLAKELQRNYWLYNFPVRISAELAHGFGYNLYLFYAPIVYYTGAFLMIFLKLSHIVATKWVYAFPLLVGPLFFYFAVRQRFGRLPSLIATCFYTFFPFRGYDTYIRGGVGEAWAMVFFPASLGFLFLSEKKKIGYSLFSIFLALALISHNISGLMILGFILLFGLVFYAKKIEFWLSVLLAMGLSAFYWLPSLYYLPIVKVNYSSQNTGQVLNFLDPLINLFKIQFPYNPEGRYSGIFFWIFLLIFIFFGVNFRRIKKNIRKEFLFWFFSGLSLYFLLSVESKLLWQFTLPISRLLQFPWRVLVVLSFILPYLMALGVTFIKKTTWQMPVFILMIVLVFFFLPSFKPKEYSYFYEYSAEDTGICATTWEDEYLPVWVKECAGGPARKIIDFPAGVVNVVRDNKLDIEAKIEAKKQGDLIVYKYYFPGWNVLVDGKKVRLDYKFSKNGIFRTQIQPGTHMVKIFYAKTRIMWVADLISLLSLIIFGYTLLSRYKEHI